MKRSHALLYFVRGALIAHGNTDCIVPLDAAAVTLTKDLASLASEAAKAHRAANSLTAELIARIEDELSGQKRLKLGK